jgi:hypothetical protein
MTTTERLQQYYEFDESIVGAISEVAESQNRRSFINLAEEFGLTDGALPLPVYQTERDKPFDDSMRRVEYIDLQPRRDYDETRARLLFTPMGISVDQSIAMRAMRLFAADPTERLIVVGSPARLGNNANLVRLGDMPLVWAGKLNHVVAPALKLLRKKGISNVATLGYSYGADTAVTAAAEAERYSLQANQGVWAESPAVLNRGTPRLISDFTSSGSELDNYVKAANSRPLNEAREAADASLAWAGGMLRLSNIAIAHMLSRDSFGKRAMHAFKRAPELRATLAWGTSSELTDNDRMEDIVTTLRKKFPSRVGAIALEGMHHAGGDDIDLHAAIMLQGLSNVR